MSLSLSCRSTRGSQVSATGLGQARNFPLIIIHEVHHANQAELEHIFVEPSQLSRGFGTALFRHAATLARDEGFSQVVIQSDPNAAGFYRALGATLVKEIPSSIPGRTIPCFTYLLETSP